MSEYLSRLHEKLDRYRTPVVTESLCCWTDLLGFGAPLYEARWEPSQALWSSIFDRITQAHADCYRSLTLLTEFALTLNDGIVRCCNLEDIRHIDQLSMWFRDCVLTHNRINERERNRGLPGARTVLAYGQKLTHGPAELTLEDFVLNYTKPDPSGSSSLPKRVAARPVALNPEPLQLNLAFSRAYILDRLGSRSGIKGTHFYVEEGVFQAVARIAETRQPSRGAIDQEQQTNRLFAIPWDDGSRFHLGFRLERPALSLETPEIVTKIARVLGFYPCDEPLPFFLSVE